MTLEKDEAARISAYFDLLQKQLDQLKASVADCERRLSELERKLNLNP